MKALREAAGRDLQWVGKAEFELRDGDAVCAILHAREQGVGWTLGETADGRWALSSQNTGPGELLVISELDAQARVAVVKRGRQQGLLRHDSDYMEVASGVTWTWKKASTWYEEWDWVDRNSEPVIHFRRGRHIEIEPSARALPDLSLLVLAGWQLVRMQEEAKKKAALAAVAATVSSHVAVSH